MTSDGTTQKRLSFGSAAILGEGGDSAGDELLMQLGLRRPSVGTDVLNSDMVLEMLTILNGGKAPRKCTCKLTPGAAHTCMTPAASVFASLAPSIQASAWHS